MRLVSLARWGVVKPVSPFDNDSTLGLTLAGSQMQQVASGRLIQVTMGQLTPF